MNKIYSVIWNTSKHCWSVASELVSNKGGANYRCTLTNNDAGRNDTLAERHEFPVSLLHHAVSSLFNSRTVLASAAIPLLLSLGGAPEAFAAPGDGIYVNDGIDGACSRLGDPNSGGTTNALCTSADKSTQTSYTLFYNPQGATGLGSTSLTLGNELFVNGGTTTGLLAPVTAAAHINTLDMRGTKIVQLANGTLSATSADAVNGSQLNATNLQIDNIVNNGAGIKYFHSNSSLGDSTATGTDSVAIGPLANASPPGGIAIGHGARAINSISPSVAIGSSANTSAVFATALGPGANASGGYSIALGVNTQATILDSVALGAHATTTTATATANGVINGSTYTYAGGNPFSVLSIGTLDQQRQIQNVAAGQVSATSTDAVNGSQLNATNTAVNALGTQNQNFTSALGGGAALNPATGAWTAPSFSTTTVNAAGTATGTTTTSNVGDALTSLSNSLANTAAVGVKYDDATTRTRVTFNPGGNATTLTNVAAGTLSATSTDAVNGSQLNATNTSVTDLGNSLNTSITNLGNSFNTQLG
ncbi:ESPR-type extended signal peptide-containing protein, partial [Pseudomonas aeruginosa]|uniref:ESPR-type extended signal peptide-containing protein n=2 Tax=Pseudomonas aeruginosa TaxID=287 RepID=UPI0024B6364B